jgi:hypothetical protein
VLDTPAQAAHGCLDGGCRAPWNASVASPILFPASNRCAACSKSNAFEPTASSVQAIEQSLMTQGSSTIALGLELLPADALVARPHQSAVERPQMSSCTREVASLPEMLIFRNAGNRLRE